jgi:hypothetical protein
MQNLLPAAGALRNLLIETAICSVPCFQASAPLSQAVADSQTHIFAAHLVPAGSRALTLSRVGLGRVGSGRLSIHPHSTRSAGRSGPQARTWPDVFPEGARGHRQQPNRSLLRAIPTVQFGSHGLDEAPEEAEDQPPDTIQETARPEPSGRATLLGGDQPGRGERAAAGGPQPERAHVIAGGEDRESSAPLTDRGLRPSERRRRSPATRTRRLSASARAVLRAGQAVCLWDPGHRSNLFFLSCGWDWLK